MLPKDGCARIRIDGSKIKQETEYLAFASHVGVPLLSETSWREALALDGDEESDEGAVVYVMTAMGRGPLMFYQREYAHKIDGLAIVPVHDSTRPESLLLDRPGIELRAVPAAPGLRHSVDHAELGAALQVDRIEVPNADEVPTF